MSCFLGNFNVIYMSHIILPTGQKGDMAHIDFSQAIVSTNDRAGLKLTCIILFCLRIIHTDTHTLKFPAP